MDEGQEDLLAQLGVSVASAERLEREVLDQVSALEAAGWIVVAWEALVQI
jgi:hypothetical protein